MAIDRKPSAHVVHNHNPVRCQDCGPGMSPHEADLWVGWRVDGVNRGRAACERRLSIVVREALAEQGGSGPGLRVLQDLFPRETDER